MKGWFSKKSNELSWKEIREIVKSTSGQYVFSLNRLESESHMEARLKKRFKDKLEELKRSVHSREL